MAQMEVSYSRRLDYQYMMIETDEEARSDYRLSMLINNRINGFLPVHVQQMNGKRNLVPKFLPRNATNICQSGHYKTKKTASSLKRFSYILMKNYFFSSSKNSS